MSNENIYQKELIFRPTVTPNVSVWESIFVDGEWEVLRHTDYRTVSHSTMTRLSDMLDSWSEIRTGVYHNTRNGAREYWVAIEYRKEREI